MTVISDNLRKGELPQNLLKEFIVIMRGNQSIKVTIGENIQHTILDKDQAKKVDINGGLLAKHHTENLLYPHS